MKVEILKPIAGTGDFVAGSPGIFSLDQGAEAEVLDETAQKWIASGIARPAAAAAERAAEPESAMLAAPKPKRRGMR